MRIKQKKKKKQSGITAAKKRYTDKRKVKLGELRALKSKEEREEAMVNAAAGGYAAVGVAAAWSVLFPGIRKTRDLHHGMPED